jgi:hemolysin activation/secretion protein
MTLERRMSDTRRSGYVGIKSINSEFCDGKEEGIVDMARLRFVMGPRRFCDRWSRRASCRLVYAAILSGLIVNSAAALAQAVDSGALMRQQQQNAPAARSGPTPSAVAPKLEIQRPEAETAQTQASGKIFVKRFRLSSPSTLLSEPQLNRLLGNFLQRENTIENLHKASEEVSNNLRERGYAFARAFLPQQEIVDGTVMIEISQGKLSKEADGQPSINVKTEGKTRLNQARVKAMVAAAVSDAKGLNVKDLERGLLLLNDLPGVQGTGLVVPGREPGTAGLNVDIREGPLVRGWLGYDNFGSRSTGMNRGTADVSLTNPSGRGDLADLNLAKSSGTESVTASYLMPLGLSGLRARLAASGLQYRVEDSVSVTDAEGGSVWLSAGLSYPVMRSQTDNLYLSGSIDGKQFKDSVANVQISSRRTQSLSVGAQANHQSPTGGRLLSFSASLTGGSLDRGGVPSDLAVDEVTRHAQGGYGILRATGSWMEQLNADFSASVTLATQFASKNLDTSEKIYLGGPRGVRAYPIEEAGSDEGAILNLEARWRAVQARERSGQEWTLFTFFDVGRAVLNKNTWSGWNAGNPNLRNDYTLSGWGLGIRGQIAQTAQFEFVWARKIGSNPGVSLTGLDADGHSDKDRVWLVGTVFF